MNNRPDGFGAMNAKRASLACLLMIGFAGCYGSPPVELVLSQEKSEDVLEITIKNNSAEEIAFSRRFLTMLPRDNLELHVVVATQDGAKVPMCRGLDYLGPDSRLKVGARQSASIEVHTSALIQTHCLDHGVPYTIQFEIETKGGGGGKRRFFSNALSLNP